MPYNKFYRLLTTSTTVTVTAATDMAKLIVYNMYDLFKPTVAANTLAEVPQTGTLRLNTSKIFDS